MGNEEKEKDIAGNGSLKHVKCSYKCIRFSVFYSIRSIAQGSGYRLDERRSEDFSCIHSVLSGPGIYTELTMEWILWTSFPRIKETWHEANHQLSNSD
jgi:hypothetical protein